MQGLTADAAMSMRALDQCHIWVYCIPDFIISSLGFSSAFPLAITGTGVQRHALLRAETVSRFGVGALGWQYWAGPRAPSGCLPVCGVNNVGLFCWPLASMWKSAFSSRVHSWQTERLHLQGLQLPCTQLRYITSSWHNFPLTPSVGTALSQVRTFPWSHWTCAHLCGRREPGGRQCS